MQHTVTPRLPCAECGAPVSLNQALPSCLACGATITVLDDQIWDLRADSSLDTLLDIETYDAEHGVGAQSKLLADTYQSILKHDGVEKVDTALEIGAGSGNLTAGLKASDFFASVFTSDISPGFMRRLIDRVGPAPGSVVRYMLLDANRMPFSNDSFDCVLGHSILHHLIDFEVTIAECHRVVRPGGACAFGEPVLDSHVYAGLAAALILHSEIGDQPEDSLRIKGLRALAQRPGIKRANLAQPRDGLAAVEDKFIFPIDYMQDLARSVGFASFACVSPPGDHDLGRSARMIIERTFRQLREDTGFLDRYAYVFDTLTENLGKPMALNGLTPFSYFVFRK